MATREAKVRKLRDRAATNRFFDGLAVDEAGTVYVADYSAGTLVRLSDDEIIATLPTPASLAFRGGTLFVTDYRLNQPDAEGGLYSIELGLCSGQLLRAQP